MNQIRVLKKLSIAVWLIQFALTAWIVQSTPTVHAKAEGSRNKQKTKLQSSPKPDYDAITDAKHRITIEIASIVPLSMNAKAAGGTINALLELLIRNSGVEDVNIHFSKIANGKGARLANPQGTAPAWEVGEDSRLAPYAAETSLVRYQWFNSTEECVISEQVFITNDSLTIPANGLQILHLPIKLPDVEGNYRIALQLDNTMLPALHPGTNNRLLAQNPSDIYIMREASSKFHLRRNSSNSSVGHD